MIRKTKLISKFMMSQQGKTDNCNTHIAQYLNKYRQFNQTIKFSQLIKYNMKNIFLEKSYTKCGGETFPRPISLDQ